MLAWAKPALATHEAELAASNCKPLLANSRIQYLFDAMGRVGRGALVLSRAMVSRKIAAASNPPEVKTPGSDPEIGVVDEDASR